jgi:hypothetical protein
MQAFRRSPQKYLSRNGRYSPELRQTLIDSLLVKAIKPTQFIPSLTKIDSIPLLKRLRMNDKYAFRMLVCSIISSVPSTALFNDSKIRLNSGNINSSRKLRMPGYISA